MANIEKIEVLDKSAKKVALEQASRGKTLISDEVVTSIARMAAETVEGVHKIGVSGLRGMLGKLGNAGVKSEVGMKQAAVNIDVVVQYGYPIEAVAQEIRTSIIDAIEHMANRQVVAVDINVVDIFVEAKTEPSSRLLE